MNPIVYLHGFASSPGSTKARFFCRKLEEVGIPIAVPDLAAGDFENLTITGQLRVLEQVAGGKPVNLIGSSMGGYLAALYAARHAEVDRLVLLAPAFCFAKRWPEVLGEIAMDEWRTTGWRWVRHYGDGLEHRLKYHLIEDAAQYEEYPHVQQPALILHGTQDDVVPAGFSQEFAMRRPNSRLVLLPSGHELTDVLELLWSETARFLKLWPAEFMNFGSPGTPFPCGC